MFKIDQCSCRGSNFRFSASERLSAASRTRPTCRSICSHSIRRELPLRVRPGVLYCFHLLQSKYINLILSNAMLQCCRKSRSRRCAGSRAGAAPCRRAHASGSSCYSADTCSTHSCALRVQYSTPLFDRLIYKRLSASITV